MNNIKGVLYLVDLQNNYIQEVKPIDLIDGNYQLKLFTDIIDEKGHIYRVFQGDSETLANEEIKQYIKTIGKRA